jgi:NADH-quinone oxidoreductase subunit C
MNQELKKKINSSFPSAKISLPKENRVVIEVNRDAVISVLSFLKNMGYEHLSMISCVDWIKEDEFELIYFLNAYMENDEEYGEIEKSTILLKTRISRKEAKYITAIGIFASAEPYERELHELFGIYFEGHPRLTPLLLERVYEIPPFRKDFDTRKYVKEFFEEIPFVEDRKEGKE